MMIVVTDAEKIELAEKLEPVVRRHEVYFLGTAFADASVHYTQWRERLLTHEEAIWQVKGLLQGWWDDSFPYEEPTLRPIHPVGTGWQNDRGEPWLWRGSTDFRLPERVGAGVDIRPILRDRKSAGANLVRMLAMKANNTGWIFDPRRSDYAEVVRQTFDILADERMYVEWTIFADTKLWQMGNIEQLAFYDKTCDLVRGYAGHVFLELVNEAGHATQQVSPSIFTRPTGIITSHGSGLSDVQPPQPFWDYATYHGRRNAYPSPKTFTNYDGYVFRDGDPYPLPCPFIGEETLKPEHYDYNTDYARLLGQHARIAGGGTFHHQAWNDARLFTKEERHCAEAFYQGLVG